jgi:hypothetical protein
VGYTLACAQPALPPPRLFTNGVRRRHGIGADSPLRLAQTRRDTRRFIHTRRCLMVEGHHTEQSGEGTRFHLTRKL